MCVVLPLGRPSDRACPFFSSSSCEPASLAAQSVRRPGGRPRMQLPGVHERRARRHAGAHRGAHVAPHARGRLVVAAVALEARRRRGRAPRRAAHRCGSSRRPWSAKSASCIGQNAPCRAAASAAARERRARAGAWPSARSGGRRRGPARSRSRSCGERAERAGEVAVDDDQRRVRRARGRGRRAPSAGTGALVRSIARTRYVQTHTLTRDQHLPGPPSEVFPFFADARNLEAITPPLLRFEVVTPGDDRDGRRDADPVPPAAARRPGRAG